MRPRGAIEEPGINYPRFESDEPAHDGARLCQYSGQQGREKTGVVQNDAGEAPPTDTKFLWLENQLLRSCCWLLFQYAPAGPRKAAAAYTCAARTTILPPRFWGQRVSTSGTTCSVILRLSGPTTWARIQFGSSEVGWLTS